MEGQILYTFILSLKFDWWYWYLIDNNIWLMIMIFDCQELLRTTNCWRRWITWPWTNTPTWRTSRSASVELSKTWMKNVSASFCLQVSSWPSGKLPFECQKIVKNLTFFQKIWLKLSFFGNFFEKKSQVFGNFLTFKWQFSGGSDCKYRHKWKY